MPIEFLPAFVSPLIEKGFLPAPSAPSNHYLHNVLRNFGRRPGDIVVKSTVTQNQVSAPRKLPIVGLAKIWKLEYQIKIVGLDGPTTIYLDRTAIIPLR
jgi:hypothetical protein